ncbi:MAG: glycosyltransferase family 61 protein [Nitratireductor sp.]|nr:glycosyltransferase family 61 protein [Nitratireductor sp.]
MSESGDIIAKAFRVALAAPLNLDAAERSATGFPQRYDGPPVRLRRFEHVWLGKRSQIIDEAGIAPQSYPPGEMPDRRHVARVARIVERWKEGAIVLDGERLLVSDWWSANYYHWMADTLPRLEAALSVRDAWELLLPASACEQAFVRESLKAYPQIAVTRYDPDEQPVQVGKLAVPTHVADNGFHHPVFTPRVFARLSRHLSVPPKPGGRRLHVTRRNARMRQLVNEEQILPVLSAYGFETVDFDGMTLGEQARLMGEAQVIAGAHGAGLTNMGFMARGGAVVEMRHLAGPSNCYVSLASTLGHGHFVVPSEPSDGAAHLHAMDITVAPDRLRRVLDMLEVRLAAAAENGRGG